jgi:DNA mismatch endonuclease (patch repair protein)
VRRLGLRYRVNDLRLPGKPDLVFQGARLVVFVDGDFWHGRDLAERRARLAHGHNAAYWIAKVEANLARDVRQAHALEQDGWTVLRVWESDVLGDADRYARTIAEAVASSSTRHRAR